MSSYDIEFDGKRFRKEDFCYYPHNEPKSQMLYAAAFWELWKKAKGIIEKEWKHGKLYELNRKFRKAFNSLCRERKKEQKPITWDDIVKLELNT